MAVTATGLLSDEEPQIRQDAYRRALRLLSRVTWALVERPCAGPCSVAWPCLGCVAVRRLEEAERAIEAAERARGGGLA